MKRPFLNRKYGNCRSYNIYVMVKAKISKKIVFLLSEFGNRDTRLGVVSEVNTSLGEGYKLSPIMNKYNYHLPSTLKDFESCKGTLAKMYC